MKFQENISAECEQLSLDKLWELTDSEEIQGKVSAIRAVAKMSSNNCDMLCRQSLTIK